MRKPVLAVTLGDPAGIGPEIVLRAALNEEVHKAANLVCVGDQELLSTQAQHLGVPVTLGAAGSAESRTGYLPVHSAYGLRKVVRFGEVDAECGMAAYKFLQEAVALALAGRVDGVVTCPINKEAWKAARVPHIGHTEALCSMFGAEGETLFVVGALRIFFLTRHVALRRAVNLITCGRLLDLLRHAKKALAPFGIKEPKIAVAGLNPHAGEGGMFGDEEGREIIPAIEAAVKEGISVFGPVGADSVFHQCAQGRYDAVISLYHDQGHIAAKMHDFYGTVSVTTGLPVIRTSVDHGTAFDIAGKGVANPGSLIEAILLAAKLASHQQRVNGAAA